MCTAHPPYVTLAVAAGGAYTVATHEPETLATKGTP
jgi:hypothetical protein